MPDTGNPNFFKTYKGRYELTPEMGVEWDNNLVMLTCTNFVQILGKATIENEIGSEATLAILPSECVPDGGGYCLALANGTLTVLAINSYGEISTTEALSAGTVTPLCYHIAGNFYKQEVQNG